MAKVACGVVNGISIRLYKDGYDDGTGDGVRPIVADGPPVRLAGPSALHAGTANASGAGLDPVVNEVDGDWIGKWLEQNKSNPFVTGGLIKLLEEEPGPNPT